MAWYALKVRVSQEKKVSMRIRQELERLGLSHRVTDILVPMEKVLEDRKGGKKRERDRVFMPGYLFLDIPMEEDVPELIQILRSIPDVMYFVSPTRGAKPVPLSDIEISPILSRVRSAETPIEIRQDFEVGQAVRIIEGPFAGFQGYVAEVYPEKQRIQVRVKIFNRETPVELPYYHAEKI
ncbi:MAG: transcription termination/antitermination protein NusG [Bacteroidia bacterium]|nr:transcription termination/antitermination protein NusG [Bacteroidia bacterium]MDW8133840.1 transcription termination/antitermination protein NusG [Bacteroidia bacterium]